MNGVMKTAVIHGSPRNGNTYKAMRIFMDELALHGGGRIFPRWLCIICRGLSSGSMLGRTDIRTSIGVNADGLEGDRFDG
jgi:hypothetical protein